MVDFAPMRFATRAASMAVLPAPTTTTFPDMLPEATGMLPDLHEGMDDMSEAAGDMVDSLTGQPTAVPESTGVTSMDKARRVVEQIEDELERLSEVDDAQVVIAGNKAAVALEFDDHDERNLGTVAACRLVLIDGNERDVGGLCNAVRHNNGSGEAVHFDHTECHSALLSAVYAR